jgi:predicted tellurium resistance membrane protein TerC
MAKQAPRHIKLATAASGLIGLVLAYGFLTRALETASYWQYLGFFLFTFLGLKLITRTFKTHGKD